MARIKIPGALDRLPSGKWRWRVSVGGKRHNFVLKLTDKRQAEAWAQAKYAELDAQQARVEEGLPGPIPCSELIAAFRSDYFPTKTPGTQGAYQDSLKHISPFLVEQLHDPTVDRVRRAHVKQFLRWRRTHRLNGSGPVSNRTLNKDRTVMHTLFAFAEENEWRESNPVDHIRAERAVKKEHPIITEADFARLVKASDDPMLTLYLTVLWETGMRPGEPLGVRFDDVDFAKNVIRLHSGDTKTRTQRNVAISKPLAAALRDHFAKYRFAQYDGKPSEWVLHHTSSAARRVAGGRIGNLGDGFRAAAKRAKMPARLTLHSLRHNYVTRMVEAGHPLTLIARQVGHSSIKMTDFYTKLSDTATQALVALQPTRRAAAR